MAVSDSTNSYHHFITVTRQLICEAAAPSPSREADTLTFYSTEQTECKNTDVVSAFRFFNAFSLILLGFFPFMH